MTTDRRNKIKARTLAAETGRSYTHARARLSATSPAEASTGPAPFPTLAGLHREALEFARLLAEAGPFLEIYAAAARRLAETEDPAAFYRAAAELSRDIDDLRDSPNGRGTDALFRLRANPVGVGWALTARARALAMNRCEIDPRDRACTGERTVTLAVWTVDGLAETWAPLCAGHAADYAATWDPGYAELVVGGDREQAAAVVRAVTSSHRGRANIRQARRGEDDYGQVPEPDPAAGQSEPDPVATLDEVAAALTVAAVVDLLADDRSRPMVEAAVDDWDGHGIRITVRGAAGIEIRSAEGDLVGVIDAAQDGTPARPLVYRAVIRPEQYPDAGMWGVPMPAGFLPPDPARAAAGERGRWIPAARPADPAPGTDPRFEAYLVGGESCEDCMCCTAAQCAHHRCPNTNRLGESICPCTCD